MAVLNVLKGGRIFVPWSSYRLCTAPIFGDEKKQLYLSWGFTYTYMYLYVYIFF